VASPFGFSESGRHYYEAVLLPALSTVVEPVNPWALSTQREVDRAREAGRARDMMLEIGRRNEAAIRGSAILVACLEGQEPDSGTVAELGYAAALGKQCFGLRSDFRQAGEEGMVVNLQVETFVVDSGGVIAPTLTDLVSAIRESGVTPD
jgi:nucleoside 2-deoxyribosyltransferase